MLVLYDIAARIESGLENDPDDNVQPGHAHYGLIFRDSSRKSGGYN